MSKRFAALMIAAALAAPGVALADEHAAPLRPNAEAAPGDAPHGVDPHVSGEHGESHGGHHDASKTFNYFDGLDLSYKNKDQYGGPLGDNALGPDKRPLTEPEQPMSVPFILVLFNFGLLLIILAKFGAPAARQAAEKRSDDIKAALDEAARLRNQAKAKLDEYNTKLRAAEAEMAKLVSDMRADAESEKQRIIAAAETQAALLKKDAEERIAAEIARARHELQLEVVAAATTVAEKMVRDQATAADQNAMVSAFVDNVAAAARQERAR
jgi:F-type H+-transporting ATPase subunit b